MLYYQLKTGKAQNYQQKPFPKYPLNGPKKKFCLSLFHNPDKDSSSETIPEIPPKADWEKAVCNFQNSIKISKILPSF